MKRSEINDWLEEAKDLFEKNGFKLPPFADWELEDWKEIKTNIGLQKKYAEIIENGLGWDLTDFGSGDFLKIGLLLFTIRNGNPSNPNYKKKYAEKIMISRENQVTPMHYHWEKCEDIINRGGGNLVIELYNASIEDDLKPAEHWKKGVLGKDEVNYVHDGILEVVPAGTKIILKPGESITLTPRMYHSFWAKKGSGTVMVGEVSMVNDDKMDNRFYKEIPRFSEIENDEVPIHVLVNEYNKLLK